MDANNVTADLRRRRLDLPRHGNHQPFGFDHRRCREGFRAYLGSQLG